MKTLLLMLILSALLCGCGQRAEVKKLQQEMAQLRADLERDHAAFLEYLSLEHAQETNSSRIIQLDQKWRAGMLEQDDALTRMIEDVSTSLDERVVAEVKRSMDALRAQAGQRVGAAPVARPVQEPTREGIPASVYNQISADVAKRYPTDFSMQRIHDRWSG